MILQVIKLKALNFNKSFINCHKITLESKLGQEDQNIIKEHSIREQVAAEPQTNNVNAPPSRKISRFLVSPVVEQRSVVTDGETTIRHEVVEQAATLQNSTTEISKNDSEKQQHFATASEETEVAYYL